MTLGILKIAALPEQAEISVNMLDLSGVENFEQVVHDYAQSQSTTCFGLTATTPQMLAASKIHKTICAVQPNARIILGRPHVTFFHAAQLY